jgi:hypothetical protein
LMLMLEDDEIVSSAYEVVRRGQADVNWMLIRGLSEILCAEPRLIND